MGKKSRLKAARRRVSPARRAWTPGEDDLEEELAAHDELVGLALDGFRAEGGIAGLDVLRYLGVMLVARQVGIEPSVLAEQLGPSEQPMLLAGTAGALMSIVCLAQAPGRHRDAARWALEQTGVSLADLGVKLLPPASDAEAEESSGRMLQRVAAVARRVWTTVDATVSAPG